MVESVSRDDKEKSRDKDRSRDKEREKEREKDKSRDKGRGDRDRDRDRERESKDRDKDREKDKYKSRSRDDRDDKGRVEKEKERDHRGREKDDKERKDSRDSRSSKDKERESRDSRKDGEREREKEKEKEREKEKEKEKEEDTAMGDGGAEISLSVEETNKLRAKLGIAPLKVDTGPDPEELARLAKEREEYEQDVKTLQLAEKIEKAKNKRMLTQKMAGKSIAEEAAEEDDDALSWIDKSRKLETEKALALQRARMMEELDEEQEQTREDYSSQNLKGLKVAHDAEQFGENEEILVLKDTYIAGKDGLNEDDDELESIHISEAARRKKNADAAKKKPLYDVYGDNAEKQDLLPQYNEDKKSQGVVLGAGGEVDVTKQQQLDDIRKKLSAVKQEAYSLEVPAHLTLVADYLTTEEMAKFKKPERKRKKKTTTRKKESLSDILATTTTETGTTNDHGSRKSRTEGAYEQKLMEDKSVKAQNYEKALAKAAEESKLLYSADADEDEDFYSTLAQSRKAPGIASVAAAVEASAARRRQEEANAPPNSIIEYDDDDEEDEDAPKKSGPLVMSSTSEFVRNIHLDEKPSVASIKSEPGTASVRTSVKEEARGEDDVKMKDEDEEREEDEEKSDEEDDARDAMDEPLVSGSLAATLQFLKQKGSSSMPFDAYVGRANDKRVAAKDDPAPNIRIEYLDENGRPMTLKEAFRAQSYKFHGKKPGKNNQEKRLKQLEIEKRKLAASSTDTPLKTAQALQDAQKKTGSAYIVLHAGAASIASRAETDGSAAPPSSSSSKRKGNNTSGANKRGKS